MSVASILDPTTQTIQPSYLPTNPTPHPYVENPMTSNLSLGGFALNCPVAFQSSGSADTVSLTTSDPLNPNAFRVITSGTVNVGTPLRFITSTPPYNAGLYTEISADANGNGIIASKTASNTLTLNSNTLNINPGVPGDTTVNLTGNFLASTGFIQADNYAYSLASVYAGSVILVGGVAVVPFAPFITADWRVILQRRTFSGTIGQLAYTILPGTSFTINSSNAGDTSEIEYYVIPRQ